MEIRHVVVLMLENRSFDSMCGQLHPTGAMFDGLTGAEENVWHKPDGSEQLIQVWTDPNLGPANLTIPDPDPGELFTDIQMQIHGVGEQPGMPSGSANMTGFVDNYMRQQPLAANQDPYSVMHYFTPNHVPVISQLAREFGVSDRWFASAPCQTWPNRFFVHCGTAAGYVNNSPTHFPYEMETVFNRLAGAGATWGIYYHDIPQAVTLSRLWPHALTHFHLFETRFASDATAGILPSYSFIEPRYFPNRITGTLPNDEHPPHDLGYGERLIADVYNAVRSGPYWHNTLLIITYDEHGGCYDHVPPPAAKSPGAPYPDGFRFDYFGVRVPAVIVSPYVRKGSIIRPNGAVPFDHTSIISTLRRLHQFAPLTDRDAAAPSIFESSGFDPEPSNDGPPAISPTAVQPVPAQVSRLAMRPPNDMQKSLATAALHLPTMGADMGAHIRRLTSVADTPAVVGSAGDAGLAAAAHMRAFVGK